MKRFWTGIMINWQQPAESRQLLASSKEVTPVTAGKCIFNENHKIRIEAFMYHNMPIFQP
jgi:hypothetical protein